MSGGCQGYVVVAKTVLAFNTTILISITLHLLCILSVWPDGRLVNPKPVAYASVREYKLCMDS